MTVSNIRPQHEVEEVDISPTDLPNREFDERQFWIRDCPLTVVARTHKTESSAFEILYQGEHGSPMKVMITGKIWMKEKETQMFLDTLLTAMDWARKGFTYKPPKRGSKKRQSGP